jgi:hypothetical protein
MKDAAGGIEEPRVTIRLYRYPDGDIPRAKPAPVSDLIRIATRLILKWGAASAGVRPCAGQTFALVSPNVSRENGA